MSLYLVESILSGIHNKEGFEKKVKELEAVITQKNVHLIEIQVSKEFTRTFFIFETEERNAVVESLREVGLAITLIKAVRLVGKDLEEVKKEKESVNYLVEWNIPENVTMDAYLARKQKNSVHYAEVPEVSFSRTYVCEDMTKCLCFYDAPDESAVKKARKAVDTPIDTITEIVPQ